MNRHTTSPTNLSLRLVLGLAAIPLLLALFLTAVSADDNLTNAKLNGPVPPTADVQKMAISPDGKSVVFIADILNDEAGELFSAPIDASAEPTLLSSGFLPSGTDVENFAITPDSSRVVYVAAQDTSHVTELYSVPLQGGPITKLNPLMTIAGASVVKGLLDITPDSNHVVFMADTEATGERDIYRVPVAGGPAVRLNDVLPAGKTVALYRMSPDGSLVVYLSNHEGGANQLYAAPLFGGTPYKLNDPLPAGGSVSNFAIGPDSEQIVFIADQDSPTVNELYGVDLKNPLADAIKLNPPLVPGGDVQYYDLTFSPNGSRVAYFADQEINDHYELYTVALTGGAAKKVHLPLAGGFSPGSCHLDDCFEFTPDGSHIVYIAEQDTAGVHEIYSTHLKLGQHTKLNGPMVAGGDIYSFEISPDGQTVVYYGDQINVSDEEVFSVPLVGGTPAKLNSALAGSGYVVSYKISPDGQRVVYVATQQSAGVTEIYSVPIKDGPITKLNPPLVTDGDIYSNFTFSADSNHVVYRADQDTNDVVELYVTGNEPAAVGFTDQTATVFENEETIAITLTIDAPLLTTASVNVAISGGTATAGDDFTFSETEITFLPGETEQALSLTVLDDPHLEGLETIALTLSNPHNLTLSPQSELTISIQDNELAPPSEQITIFLPIIIK